MKRTTIWGLLATMVIMALSAVAGRLHYRWRHLLGGRPPVGFRIGEDPEVIRLGAWAGLTRYETGHILVRDRKFGDRAKWKAIWYGDEILPVLREESEDFERLDNRNAFWIADVLGHIRTEASREILVDLYGRKDALSHLVGAIGLAQHDALPPGAVESLVTVIREDLAQEKRAQEELFPRDTTGTELAVIALANTRDERATEALVTVLRNKEAGYLHDHACEGLARFGSPKARLVLRDCLGSDEFWRLSDGFRALLALGDREAVPLAIHRVEPESEGYYHGLLVRELERVTGQSLGFDRDAWEVWWKSVERTWVIPKEFLLPWDQQHPL